MSSSDTRVRWRLVIAASCLLLGIPLSGLAGGLPGAVDEQQLPNLVLAPPNDIELGYVNRSFPEGPRALRFMTAFANLGQYPFEAVQVPSSSGMGSEVKQCVSWAGGRACLAYRDAGRTTYDPRYTVSWTISDFLVYELRRLLPDGKTPDFSPEGLVSRTVRTYICPFDAKPLKPSSWPAPAPDELPMYGQCTSYRMGLSPGWAFDMPPRADQQHVNIEGVPDGNYALVFRLDPGNRFLETNKDDNVSWRRVELSGNGTHLRVLP